MPSGLAIALKVIWLLMMAWMLWLSTYLTWCSVKNYQRLRRFAREKREHLNNPQTEQILPEQRNGPIRVVAMWLFTVAVLSLSAYWLVWDTHAS